MQRPRVQFTMRWLMAFVFLLAIGLSVIRYAVTHWGASEVMAIAPIVFLATNILAWFQRARWQVFWVGFGLCGWAYLTFSLGSPLAEYLPTAWFLDGLHDRLYANHPVLAYDDGFGDGVVSAQVHGDSFRRASQSVFSLLFALLGGSAATVLIPVRAEDGQVPFPPDGSLLSPGWRARMSSLRRVRCADHRGERTATEDGPHSGPYED